MKVLVLMGALAVVLCCVTSSANASVAERIASIRRMVKSEHVYQVGTQVQLELRMEEAALLRCADNPYGMQEILVCPTGGWLFQYIIWEDGSASGGGRRLSEGAFFRPYNSRTTTDPTGKWDLHIKLPDGGQIPIAVSETWQVQGETVAVRYRIVTDPGQIMGNARERKQEASNELRTLLEEVRERASATMQCRGGEDVRFALPLEGAVRLDCGEMGVELAEVLVWQADGKLCLGASWRDGHFSYNDYPWDYQRAFWVPSPAAVAFFVEWEAGPEGNQVLVYAEPEPAVVRSIMSSVVRHDTDGPGMGPGSLQRLRGFVHVWSSVKYHFAWFDQVPELDWEKVLDEYLPRVLRDQTRREYYRLLQECVAQLGDGHTYVVPPLPEGEGVPPLVVRCIGGKAIVVDIGGQDQGSGVKVERGVEITHVDGRAVPDILQGTIYPYVSASTPQARDRKAYSQLLQGSFGSWAAVQLCGVDGSIRTAQLKRSRPAGLRVAWQRVRHRALPGGLAYVTVPSFRSESVVEEFDAILDDVMEATALIIDVRDNGGGKTRIAHGVVSRLIAEALPASRCQTPQYTAELRAAGQRGGWDEGTQREVLPANGKRFLGPLAVLIGPGTMSAAEDFLVPLHAGGRAVLVGEKSAGSTGQPLAIELPWGGHAYICAKRDLYPDGRQFVGIGILPDVEVVATRDDVRLGRDPALEAAVELLSRQASSQSAPGSLAAP